MGLHMTQWVETAEGIRGRIIGIRSNEVRIHAIDCTNPMYNNRTISVTPEQIVKTD